MNGKGDDGIGAAIGPQSPQEKAKAPRRVENMKRINREGLAGPGGRKLDHGEYALAERLKQGLDPRSPLAVLAADYRGQYVTFFGGEENLNPVTRGLARRYAALELDFDRLQGNLTGNLRGKRLELHCQQLLRNIQAFLSAAKVSGTSAWQKEADRTVVIKPFADPEPKPAQYRENES